MEEYSDKLKLSVKYFQLLTRRNPLQREEADDVLKDC